MISALRREAEERKISVSLGSWSDLYSKFQDSQAYIVMPCLKIKKKLKLKIKIKKKSRFIIRHFAGFVFVFVSVLVFICLLLFLQFL